MYATVVTVVTLVTLVTLMTLVTVVTVVTKKCVIKKKKKKLGLKIVTKL